ncbi:hypothetical protein BC834DRAFT_883655 [Gloeopeniophorella convolvens]|nr:hypothetical protein BC834DRAFT_883655 [Gloeopeniophorella convolvens]
MCLAPEYMLSARLTLHHPMTFEFLGQDVGLFEGNALHELAQFRKYCRHSLLHCKCTLVGPNSSVISVWTRGTQPSSNEDPPQVGMEEAASCKSTDPKGIPWWIRIAFAEDIDFDFTSPLPKPQDLRSKIHAAIGNHIRQENCTFCARTFSSSGETFCNQVVNSTQQALDKVIVLSPPFRTRN